MRKVSKALALLLAAVMVLGLAACGTPQNNSANNNNVTPEPVKEVTYSMINGFDITTLDYVFNNKSSNGDFTNNFIEGLLTQDSHGTLIAGMATKWEPNADGSEWVFTIRDDAVWSTASGEEYAKVTAEDFVTGLKHAADSKSETLGLVRGLIVGLAEYCDGTGKWEDVGIKAEGNKLTYTLTGPCGYFDGMTTYSILFPINAEFLASKGADFGAVQADSILYNGCYILSSLISAQEVKFDKNPNYYDKDNVFIDHVVVTYTDGKDPAQAFNMFDKGEIVSASINPNLPDVVKVANEKYKDNQFRSMTDSTTFWGAFNWDRDQYALYNNPSKTTTNKTDKQKADTKAAILNANFRLAVYAAFSSHAYNAITEGEEGADFVIRNTLVPYTFATTSDGRSYGSIVTKYLEELVPEFKGIDLNDGHDAWFSPERAKTFIEKAKAELTGVEWPIHLDVPVNNTSENQKNMSLAMKKSIEDVIGEYVVIDLQYLDDRASYLSAYYNMPTGSDQAIDLSFGAGWGPDYGDPLTYLHCFDTVDGDMLNYSGINTADQGQTEGDKAALAAIGLAETQKIVDEATVATGDKRIELFAQAEAQLLANGILRPFETSGATLGVSRVVPFSAAYGLYGQASYNQVPYFKYMKLQDEPVLAKDYEAAKEAWLAGK